ncbi:hypothetical protein, partial [uncultured Rubinisphaera sp.]
ESSPLIIECLIIAHGHLATSFLNIFKKSQVIMNDSFSLQSPYEPPNADHQKGDIMPKLTAQQLAALNKAEREADVIEEVLFAASMAGSVSVGNQVGPNGFKVYLQRLLKQAGDPDDPLEQMMIEQTALAHHRIAQLHVKAAEAETVDAAKQYSTMAIRAMGELRRIVLAIKQYRQPTKTKHFTVVKQQNLSSGDQQVAYLDQSATQTDQTKDSFLPDGSEQTSKRLSHDTSPDFFNKSETRGSRSPEPQTTRPTESPRT